MEPPGETMVRIMKYATMIYNYNEIVFIYFYHDKYVLFWLYRYMMIYVCGSYIYSYLFEIIT